MQATKAEAEAIASVSQYDYDRQQWGTGTDHGHRQAGADGNTPDANTLLFCNGNLTDCPGEINGSITVTPHPAPARCDHDRPRIR